MLRHPETKYRPFPPVALLDRQWPSRSMSAAPLWCSVDLRDGNQALIDPMDGEKKRRLYDLLIKIGFKEIEVGFPSASQTEFDFLRHLIEDNLVPDDVRIQILTPARPELIRRSFEALRGAKKATVHLYNAVSPLFRQVVFAQDQDGVKQIAVDAARVILEEAQAQPDTDWMFQYSPETFSATELDFAVEVCDAVLDVWQPTPARKAILNLPATVEMAGPNVYADQIEWFCRHLSRRDSTIVSIHPHNDRGTGVAAAELAFLAGADRIEGCLFGNGERTGNVDLVTLALNLYTQGIDPGLDFSDMRTVVQTVRYCNQIEVHPRHPYAGELVFTAFSGSHQDAIRKGFAAQQSRNDGVWEVPYLPIDPADLGCSYEAVIRVNSQSGKGGVAWVLEQDKGLQLPRRFQIDVSRAVQEEADRRSKELTAADIWQVFERTYGLSGPDAIELLEWQDSGGRAGARHRVSARVRVARQEHAISGDGNGLIAAIVQAITPLAGSALEIVDYHEHALTQGTDAQAASYVEARLPSGGSVFGCGIDEDIATASVKAVLSAAASIRRG